MASLVPLKVAIRVLFTRVCSAEVRAHGQASLDRSCQSPQVQDETDVGHDTTSTLFSCGRPDVKLCH